MSGEKLHHVIYGWDRNLVKFFDHDLPGALEKIGYKKGLSVVSIVFFAALSGGVGINQGAVPFQLGPVELGVDEKNNLTADYNGPCLPDNSSPTRGSPEYLYRRHDGSREKRVIKIPFGNIFELTDTGLDSKPCSTRPLSRLIFIPQ